MRECNAEDWDFRSLPADETARAALFIIADGE
jgi:hypothetical protein